MTAGPQPVQRLAALDGVRAVAALAVLTTHVAFQTASIGSGPLGAIQARLDCGVAIFFALSGFLLFRPWLGHSPPTTRTYLVRRAARILPAYWAAMIVALVVDAADTRTVLAHIWLGQVYDGRLLDDFSQTWSLSTEVAFYVLLPFVAALLIRSDAAHQLRILAGVAAAGLIVTWLVRADVGIPARAGFWLPTHLSWFAAGGALAVATGPGAQRWRSVLAKCARVPGTMWVTAAVLLGFAATPLAGPLSLRPAGPAAATAKEALYTMIALLILAPFATEPAAKVTGLRALLESRSMQWLGRISYGIFLWHLLVLYAVFRVLDRPRFSGFELQIFLLTVAGSIVVAALSWSIIESPLLRRAHRATRRRDQPALSPTP